MVKVYAKLIIAGRKTFEQVPDTLKSQVRQALVELDCEHLLEA